MIDENDHPWLVGFHFGTANFSADQDPAHDIVDSFGFLFEHAERQARR